MTSDAIDFFLPFAVIAFMPFVFAQIMQKQIYLVLYSVISFAAIYWQFYDHSRIAIEGRGSVGDAFAPLLLYGWLIANTVGIFTRFLALRAKQQSKPFAFRMNITLCGMATTIVLFVYYFTKG